MMRELIVHQLCVGGNRETNKVGMMNFSNFFLSPQRYICTAGLLPGHPLLLVEGLPHSQVQYHRLVLSWQTLYTLIPVK